MLNVHLIRISAMVWLVLAHVAIASRDDEATFDLLIRGGAVIDGTGAARVDADVLVQGDQIVRVGKFDPEHERAKRILDAAGMVVTPGFIDTHAHGDPKETPAFENFLAMGVTTICLGQDGDGPQDIPTWMREVESVRPGVNIAMFVGHGAVRDAAGVGLQRDPGAQRIAAMQEMVASGMRSGCFGLTTGLEYQPGSFAKLDELIAIAQPVANAGGLVMSHMRSEDDDVIDNSLNELFSQGRGAGCPVHVSHIKVTHGRGADRAKQVLKRMQDARESGLRVTADIYPYTASYTGIGIVFPDWAKPPHDYEQVVQSRREELADFLRHRVNSRNGPEATLFGTGRFAGMTLADAAANLGKPFEDVLIEDVGLNGAHAAYFVMDAELQDRLLLDPHVMICSDGSPGSSHPRGHGAFAKVIRDYVVDRELLSLEEAVHKMTWLPAETTGLAGVKRGRLDHGYAADILVFDPDKVRDHATYESPRKLATGFAYVVVNGKVVRHDDVSTGEQAGRLLRKRDLELERRVDELFSDFDRPGVPGASVGVYRDGSVFLAKSYGLANPATGAAATPETNYRIASMTKQFTAMCVMILEERNLLSYDDPISRFFPDFPSTIGDRVTVRHLLWHTSGLYDYEDLIPDKQIEQLRDRDVLALVSAQKDTYFQPGEEYRYSNSGYALLALIVEKASGKNFAAFLKENIFEPVGMKRTVAFEEGISRVPDRAYGYKAHDDGFAPADQSLTSAVLGDGGVYTSVLDYFLWDQALYGSMLVSNAALARAFTPGRLTGGGETDYGFGWKISRRSGEPLIQHDGETCGFNSAVRRLPQRRLTVVVLTNRAGNQARQVADQLINMIVGESAALQTKTQEP